MATKQTAAHAPNGLSDDMDPQIVMAWLAKHSNKLNPKVAALVTKTAETAEKTATEDKVLASLRTKRETLNARIDTMKERHEAELSTLLSEKVKLDEEEDKIREKHGLPGRRGAHLGKARAARGSASASVSQADVKAVWDAIPASGTEQKATVQIASRLDPKAFASAYNALAGRKAVRGTRAGVQRLVSDCPTV